MSTNAPTRQKKLQRRAWAGLLWNKQLYYYDVEQWLEGDPFSQLPPEGRLHDCNRDWKHLKNFDVISMPDKWEYPWYATWDLAFHALPLSKIDPQYAKRQLTLLTREWYLHPNGQLPAYEYNFNDVNPPVHAWAALNVYQEEAKLTGNPDNRFLESLFHKMLLNFTWWVNRKDAEGKNIFHGGFLGLDNIGVLDRSKPLPSGGHLDQSDGTSWMASYSLTMMMIALELAKFNPAYLDIAPKFFEHFLRIATAMTHMGGKNGLGLWDEQDGFYYDVVHFPDGRSEVLKVRSLIGLLPLMAVETLEPETLEKNPVFVRRMTWFLDHVPNLTGNIASCEVEGKGRRRLLSLVTEDRLTRILEKMLDEEEFLSPYGIRSLSRYHKNNPFYFEIDGQERTITYEPGESSSDLFGGNSNWRGPIWFPTNYLLIESLRTFHAYYGDDFKIACPTGSDNLLNLGQVADEICRRLISLFTDAENRQAWEYTLFYEYYHAETGIGLGASHQTGWTALLINLIS